MNAIIVTIVLAVLVVSLLVNAAANICEVVDMRQARKNTSIPDYKVLWDKLQITGGMYLVTKSWYDGHKSSEMVKAKDAAEAFAKSSDDRRNLDYFIESVYKQMS